MPRDFYQIEALYAAEMRRIWQGGWLFAGFGERLQRVAFGTPDVPAAVKALRARGVDFVETDRLHTEVRGALTRPQLGGVMFELVHHDEPQR